MDRSSSPESLLRCPSRPKPATTPGPADRQCPSLVDTVDRRCRHDAGGQGVRGRTPLGRNSHDCPGPLLYVPPVHQPRSRCCGPVGGRRARSARIAPFYLPRHSIRAILVLAFVGLAVYLYREDRHFHPKPSPFSACSFLTFSASWLGACWLGGPKDARRRRSEAGRRRPPARMVVSAAKVPVRPCPAIHVQ
jgi:hypothetical protein